MALRAGELVFRPGPVFAGVVLADEINRTPPKTQAALLEAMQEGQVTIDGEPHPLPDPFLVLATQNPVEYEGTYPLPEAQRDRFLVHVAIGYPDADEERAMLRMSRRGLMPVGLDDVRPVVSAEDLRAARDEVDATEVRDEVVDYVVAVVRRTRELPSVTLGASPRAAVHLLGAAKAAARLAGRSYVTPDDVARMAAPGAAPPAGADARGRAGARDAGGGDPGRARGRAGAAMSWTAAVPAAGERRRSARRLAEAGERRVAPAACRGRRTAGIEGGGQVSGAARRRPGAGPWRAAARAQGGGRERPDRTLMSYTPLQGRCGALPLGPRGWAPMSVLTGRSCATPPGRLARNGDAGPFTSLICRSNRPAPGAHA